MSPQLQTATALKLLFVLLSAVLLFSCGSDMSEKQRVASSATSGQAAGEQTVGVTTVISQKLSLTIRLPGEITPYESVAEFPKVTAFVRWIGVDRGTHVKARQEIIRLEAPELSAQKQEAQSKFEAAEAERAAA